jgi:hypothetical protein
MAVAKRRCGWEAQPGIARVRPWWRALVRPKGAGGVPRGGLAATRPSCGVLGDGDGAGGR